MSWLYRLFLRWRDRHDPAPKSLPAERPLTFAEQAAKRRASFALASVRYQPGLNAPFEPEKLTAAKKAADKRARVRLKIAARSAKPKTAKPQNVVAFRKAGQ